MKKATSGFTIVELLIVIVVIAILAAISMVAYSNISARANDSRRMSDVDTIKKVLSAYYVDNGSFPIQVPNPGGSGWEISTDPGFLNSLSDYTGGYTFQAPAGSGSRYRYRRQSAGDNGCPASSGQYYVLWVQGMQAQPAGSAVIQGISSWCPSQTLFTGGYLTDNTSYVYFGFR